MTENHLTRDERYGVVRDAFDDIMRALLDLARQSGRRRTG